MDIVSVPSRLTSLSISNSSEGSISPSSPKSWEESLGELSKGLQIICGSSPTHETPPRGISEFDGASSRLLSPTTGYVGGQRRGLRGLQSPKLSSSPASRTLFGRSVSSSASVGSSIRTTRPLIIRHEESNEKLQEQLAQICMSTAKDSKPTSSSSTSHSPQHLSPKSKCLLARKESLKESFRARIDLSQYALKNIVICLKNQTFLQVAERTATGLRVIQQYEVDKPLRYQRLTCFITDNSYLCIREKLNDTMAAYYFGADFIYLPVVFEDETNLKLQIVLHVPDELDFEDINVKTIDDEVVISGQKQPFSGILHEEGRRALSCNSSFDAGYAAGIASSFRIVMALPEGVDNRSVSGSISDSNQLVISAALDSSSRRYTC